MRGKLIVFEGIDGCGKDTQIDKLHDYMNINDIPNTVMYNISTTCPVGKVIRVVLSDPKLYINAKQMACLFLAELIMVVKDIKINLEEGKNVIMSRYWYSTLAYAGKELEDYLLIKQIASSIDVVPDYLIYLDIPAFTAMERINNRCNENEEPEIYESTDKLEGIKKIYSKVLHMLELETYATKVVKINGTNTVESIHNEIVSSIGL